MTATREKDKRNKETGGCGVSLPSRPVCLFPAYFASRPPPLAPRPLLHASEGEAVVAPPRSGTTLATLLTRHVLRDGELVMLILRPSRWLVLLGSLRFIAIVLIVMIAGIMLDHHMPYVSSLLYVELAAILVTARVMWAVVQWMNVFYILTDMRVLRLSGVFDVDIFDCPLRKVARTRLIFTLKERLLRLGSIEIVPQDESCPPATWQALRRPREVHQQIESAIRRAKHTGMMLNAR